MTEIHGTCAPGFEAVREAFAANFAAGLEVGASVCLIRNDTVLVDLWGGHADAARTQPWQRDTVTNVWSTTKTMMFLVCLILIDRGELDPQAPVARYWPEFAANGKGAIEVRHLMSHTAGLSGWSAPMTESDLWDHEACAARSAAQAPWWEPGTASGYHAITQGYLIAEVVRRITGQSLGTVFSTEVDEPFGIDFHIGTPAALDDRVALVVPAEQGLPPGLDPTSIAARTFSNPPMDARMAHSLAWRRCESPAANGHGNARSVARAQALVSHGGTLAGRRVLSEATCRQVLVGQSFTTDLVLGVPIRFGLGYGLPSPAQPVGGPGACFWGGWGGSLVVNDLDGRFSFAYVMNRMGQGTVGDTRSASLLAPAMAAMAG